MPRATLVDIGIKWENSREKNLSRASNRSTGNMLYHSKITERRCNQSSIYSLALPRFRDKTRPH